MKFVDTAPERQASVDWAGIAHALRTADWPKWALFEGVNVSMPNTIRNGVKALPMDQFQMRTSNNTSGPKRTCDLYLRYVPEKHRAAERKAGRLQ